MEEIIVTEDLVDTFYISLTVTLNRTIPVITSSKESAINTVKRLFESGSIELGKDDFINSKFRNMDKAEIYEL